MKLSEILEDYGGWIAFVVALVATSGSLYYSEVAGFIPCRLCWYQRILMYPLTAVTLVGALRRDDYLPGYVLPLSIMGMGVSAYHYLMEKGFVAASTTCAVDVPCNISYVNYLGFITIAFMAFVAFTIITLVMAGMWLSLRRAAAQQLPIPGAEGF